MVIKADTTIVVLNAALILMNHFNSVRSAVFYDGELSPYFLILALIE